MRHQPRHAILHQIQHPLKLSRFAIVWVGHDGVSMLADELGQPAHFFQVLGRAQGFGQGLLVRVRGEDEVEALKVFVSPRRPKA